MAEPASRTSAVYDVINALVDKLPAVLPAGVVLYDGFPVSESYPAEWLLIGVEDPTIRGAAQSATASQDFSHVTGSQRDERGEITCAASSWNGDADARLARTRVEAITGAVETYLRANLDLGIKGPGGQDRVLWTRYGPRTTLRQAQDGKGAEALVVFTIAFQARI